MKRLLIIAAVLAVSFVVLWVDFLPVRCTFCDKLIFRTDVSSVLFGGHGDLWELCPAPGQTPSALAGGSSETQAATIADERHS